MQNQLAKNLNLRISPSYPPDHAVRAGGRDGIGEFLNPLIPQYYNSDSFGLGYTRI
jgi:hypothetical protein